jgi:stearoyl-CoA desaturase (delta-9 desaturase)
MTFPLSGLPWWGLVLLTLGLTHITIAAVTIFLHRHQAHRALDLHPAVSHFFRFWLWLTTGMVTREWVAIHRKHHAKCDTAEDPHSPVIFGIRRVLLSGAELYRDEAGNPETLARYGQHTPDDWLERHVYSRHPIFGIGGLLIAEVALFGPIGITIWAVQMLWIPLFAAGVINGLGHFLGYRSYSTQDASRNIVPWGILIGGEELHNNHHAYSASARLSSRWWEIDLGWVYIRLLETLGLATVRKVAPALRLRRDKTECDTDTVHAIVRHRFAILTRYARTLRRTMRAEIRALRAHAAPDFEYGKAIAAIKHWLQRETVELAPTERQALDRALHGSPVLQTIYAMRQELATLWHRSAATPEQLARQLEDWCQRAETSGIAALRQFSLTLRGYGSA